MYFYSTLDKSLYTFTGGHSLNRVKRMNSLDLITDGVFNTGSNTLLLQTANGFIWVRDGVFTYNAKKSTQTDLKLYSTTKGIVIDNSVRDWRYTYLPPTSTTDITVTQSVVPLTWQSPHLGQLLNQKSTVAEVAFNVFYDPSLPSTYRTFPVTITPTVYTRDENDNYIIQVAEPFVLGASDFSTYGYAVIKVKPAEHHSVAQSIQLSTANKVVIFDASVYFTDESKAATAPNKVR